MAGELEYDYIVVGGGTAGPVAARRLADGDPSAQVCLIEAGPTNENLLISHMPMAWKDIHKSQYDWSYDTVPQKHVNNRVIALPRGRFLGGCSAINGTLIIRGAKADYDRIANLGNPGWSWDEMLPYFKAFEHFHQEPWFDADLSMHGTGGLLHTEPHPLAPISNKVLESFVDKGFAYKSDMFVQGEYEGVGHAVRTVYDGLRTTAADFVLHSPPPNLHLRVATHVDRIIIESTTEGQFKAVGLEAHDTLTGNALHFKARKEIILSAGTYNSPVILMHSGIGPKEHLAEVGIDTKVNLPGVGSNLIDHLIVDQNYRVPEGLTVDHLVYPPGATEAQIEQWNEKRTGVMSYVPFGVFALSRLDKTIKDPIWDAAKAATAGQDPTGQLAEQPHVEYMSTEFYGILPRPGEFPSEGQSVVGLALMLCGPRSRGTVRLASNKLTDAPIVDHNYFSAGVDLAILAEGMRLGHEIMTEGKGTKDIVSPWPPQRVYPTTNGEWKEMVKARANTCFHPAGTVKMAPADDPMGCVNARLQLRNVAQLRVADVSILPYLNSGHTQVPAYAIGEKVAAMVLEDHAAA